MYDNEDNVNGYSFREYEREEYLMLKQMKLDEKVEDDGCGLVRLNIEKFWWLGFNFLCNFE